MKKMSLRLGWFAVLAAFVFGAIIAAGLSAGGAAAGSAAGASVGARHGPPIQASVGARHASPLQVVPDNDAYLEFRPRAGGPPNGGTVNVGARFVLEMWVVGGSHTDLTAQQSYLVWNHAVLQNARVDQIGSSCILTSTVTAISNTFEVVLQNEVCNGPSPCNFRGNIIDPGSYAFASGALINPPAGGQFKVAEFGICAVAPGQSTMRWQFAPPDPVLRDSYIVDVNSNIVSNRNLFTNYVINVAGAPTVTGTPPTATRTPTQGPPTSTPTQGSATVTPTPCTINFSDVLPTDYFYEAVRYLYCMGAISGYSDGTFRPYNNTTRGQLSKIVVLAEQWAIYVPPSPTFIDVPPTDTFYQYIETAFNRGIISGYSDGTFRPGNNVTRGQLCKIVVLAEGWPLINPPTPTFTDVPTTDTFYQYIETAFSWKVISGYADGTFRPGNPATRGQISKIVYNAITVP